MGQVTYSSLARATELYPQSIHSEAYRFLGLTLLNPRNAHIRSLMVLSAKAEQGSTTTLTNLGITLAQAGKRVIVVDANIRTAELHTVFGIDNDFGFTDVVRTPSNANLNRAIRPTTIKNLQIMTSGSTPANPWELFHDSHIHDLSLALHERADYVLFDTPSAAIFTDALNLAPVIDGAFLCVRALEQLTGAEQRMIEQIEQANVELLGSVLTDVPAEVVEGYRNYQHYYQPATPTVMPAEAGVARTAAIAPAVSEWFDGKIDRDADA
jgi:capsular exopolysaccharide synthesis family protein